MTGHPEVRDWELQGLAGGGRKRSANAAGGGGAVKRFRIDAPQVGEAEGGLDVLGAPGLGFLHGSHFAERLENPVGVVGRSHGSGPHRRDDQWRGRNRSFSYPEHA